MTRMYPIKKISTAAVSRAAMRTSQRMTSANARAPVRFWAGIGGIMRARRSWRIRGRPHWR